MRLHEDVKGALDIGCLRAIQKTVRPVLESPF